MLPIRRHYKSDFFPRNIWASFQEKNKKVINFSYVYIINLFRPTEMCLQIEIFDAVKDIATVSIVQQKQASFRKALVCAPGLNAALHHIFT